MYGDVISCECPLPTAFSSCTGGAGSAVWPSKLASPSSSRKRRYMRPHSSPVRNNQVKARKSHGLSSPSRYRTSPCKVQSPLPMDLFTPPPSPGLSIECNIKPLRPHKRQVKGRKSHVVSSPCEIHPPSPPQERLLSPLPIGLFTPSLSPGRSVDYNSRLSTPLVERAVSSNKAFFSSRPPPMPLMLVPVSHPSPLAVIFSYNKNVKKAPLDHNVRLIRILLNEMISTLPLSAAPTPRASVSVHDEPAVSSYKHSRLSSESSLGGNGSFKCHVATQARTNENMLNERSINEYASVGGNGNADEWLGGVRALRDSHVRLVLRQLRHIDRLNRALDRVRYPPPVKSPCGDSVTSKDNIYRP